MFETILVPYDGSESSALALRSGITLAERTGATVHVAYVLDFDDVPVDTDVLAAEYGDELAVEADGRDLLTEAASEAEDAGVAVERVFLEGHAVPELLDYAESAAVDLIVVGSHERGKIQRFLRRSVAEQIAQAATSLVLTVTTKSGGIPAEIDTILLATDGRPGSRRATDVAFDLAAAYGATVCALYVLDSRFLSSSPLRDALERESEKTMRDLEVRAAQSSVDLSGTIRDGKAVEEILAAAAENDADVIVMGTRGQTGADRLLMGSVANSVLRKASLPVLTARTVE